MEIRFPGPEDLKPMGELWQEAFGDDPAYIRDFFRHAFEPERALVLGEPGRPLAMLFWLPGKWDGRPLGYLYAVAVRRDCRGRGLGSRILQRAFSVMEEQGLAGALLVPGEPGLTSFYAGLGFSPCCPMEDVSMEPEEVPRRPLSAGEYEALREAYLRPGDAVLTGAALSLLSARGGLWETERGLAAGTETLLMESWGQVRGPWRLRRRPGGEPFAMFRPLRAGATAPERFCMALD